MRILVVTSTFPRWINDTEPAFVFELCKRLSKTFNVTVLAPHAPGSKLIETIEDVQVVRYRYFLNNLQRLTNEGGIMANLKKNSFNNLLIPFFLDSNLLQSFGYS